MKIFLVIVFLFQSFFTSFSHSTYLLLRDDKPLEFEEWRTTQEIIQRQIWVEGKDQTSITLPERVRLIFVPDSLMQAFALDQLHMELRRKIQVELPDANIDDGYLNVEGIPFKFVHPEWEADGDKAINEIVTKAFQKHQENMLKSFFLPKGIDYGFIEIIDQSPPEPLSDSDEPDPMEGWVPPTQVDAQNYYLGINFELSRFSTSRLKFQHGLESSFLQAYQGFIDACRWLDILDTFYPSIGAGKKFPHFINISLSALTEPGFLKNFSKDRDNLIKSIECEMICEQKNQVFLSRGTDGDEDDRPQRDDGYASISFGRGYYSGVLRDAHASISYRSSRHKYFIGLAAPRQIFSDLLVIPPLSWYQNLGLGGEFWHPRTTVAVEVPLETRSTKLVIQGTNLGRPIDKLGILVKVGNTGEHFSRVQDLLKGVEILRTNDEES